MSSLAWNGPLDLFARDRVRQPDAAAREELRHDIARVGFDRRALQSLDSVPAPSVARRYRLAANPAIVRRAVRLLAPSVPQTTGRIAAEEGSGLILAGALSTHLGIPLAIVRRDDAAGPAPRSLAPDAAPAVAMTVEGGLRAAETVCVVHDVVIGPGEALELVGHLRSVGADVFGVVALLNFARDAASVFGDAKLIFHALFAGADFASRGDRT